MSESARERERARESASIKIEFPSTSVPRASGGERCEVQQGGCWREGVCSVAVPKMDFLTYAHHNNKTVKDIEESDAAASKAEGWYDVNGAVDALQFLRWVSQTELAKIPGAGVEDRAEDAPRELCTDPDRLDDYGIPDRPGFDFLPATARPGRRRIGPADVAAGLSHKHVAHSVESGGKSAHAAALAELGNPSGDWHYPEVFEAPEHYRYKIHTKQPYGTATETARIDWGKKVRDATQKFVAESMCKVGQAADSYDDCEKKIHPMLQKFRGKDYWTNVAFHLDRVATFPEFQYNLVRLIESERGGKFLDELKFPWWTFGIKPSAALLYGHTLLGVLKHTGYADYLASLNPPQRINDVVGGLVYGIDDPRALPLIRLQDVLTEADHEERIGRASFHLLPDLSFVPSDFVFWFLAPGFDEEALNLIAKGESCLPPVQPYAVYSYKEDMVNGSHIVTLSVDPPEEGLFQCYLGGDETGGAFRKVLESNGIEWHRMVRGRWLGGWDVASRNRDKGKAYEGAMLSYLTDVSKALSRSLAFWGFMLEAYGWAHLKRLFRRFWYTQRIHELTRVDEMQCWTKVMPRHDLADSVRFSEQYARRIDLDQIHSFRLSGGTKEVSLRSILRDDDVRLFECYCNIEGVELTHDTFVYGTSDTPMSSSVHGWGPMYSLHQLAISFGAFIILQRLQKCKPVQYAPPSPLKHICKTIVDSQDGMICKQTGGLWTRLHLEREGKRRKHNQFGAIATLRCGSHWKPGGGHGVGCIRTPSQLMDLRSEGFFSKDVFVYTMLNELTDGHRAVPVPTQLLLVAKHLLAIFSPVWMPYSDDGETVVLPSISDLMHCNRYIKDGVVPIELVANYMCHKLLRYGQANMLSILLFHTTQRIELKEGPTLVSNSPLFPSMRKTHLTLESTALRAFLKEEKNKVALTGGGEMAEAQAKRYRVLEAWLPWRGRIKDMLTVVETGGEGDRSWESKVYAWHTIAIEQIVKAFHCRALTEAERRSGSTGQGGAPEPVNAAWMKELLYTERLWREFATTECNVPPRWYGTMMNIAYRKVNQASTEGLSRELPKECGRRGYVLTKRASAEWDQLIYDLKLWVDEETGWRQEQAVRAFQEAEAEHQARLEAKEVQEARKREIAASEAARRAERQTEESRAAEREKQRALEAKRKADAERGARETELNEKRRKGDEVHDRIFDWKFLKDALQTGPGEQEARNKVLTGIEKQRALHQKEDILKHAAPWKRDHLKTLCAWLKKGGKRGEAPPPQKPTAPPDPEPELPAPESEPAPVPVPAPVPEPPVPEPPVPEPPKKRVSFCDPLEYIFVGKPVRNSATQTDAPAPVETTIATTQTEAPAPVFEQGVLGGRGGRGRGRGAGRGGGRGRGRGDVAMAAPAVAAAAAPPPAQEAETCPVCEDAVNDVALIAEPPNNCGHRYCSGCADMLLATKNKECGLCRVSVFMKQKIF